MDFLKFLAKNPAMQSLNREIRGENHQQASPLALLLDNHPFFQNEPEHQNSRHQAFKIISPTFKIDPLPSVFITHS